VLTFAEGYDRAALTADLIAGVTVGLVALPLAMAFAIASGLTPQADIYCAIIPASSSPPWAGRDSRSAGRPVEGEERGEHLREWSVQAALERAAAIVGEMGSGQENHSLG